MRVRRQRGVKCTSSRKNKQQITNSARHACSRIAPTFQWHFFSHPSHALPRATGRSVPQALGIQRGKQMTWRWIGLGRRTMKTVVDGGDDGPVDEPFKTRETPIVGGRLRSKYGPLCFLLFLLAEEKGRRNATVLWRRDPRNRKKGEEAE